jgi:hypothetical protein
MALLNTWMKFKFFLKQYETVINKKLQNMSQGPPNPQLRSAKIQKEDFLKKNMISKIIFVLGSYESLKCLER